MAEFDVTIYKKPTVTLTVIDGDPPADQSALVADLQAQLATVTGERDAALAKINAAKAPAQATVDALA